MGWLWFFVSLVVGVGIGAATTLISQHFQAGYPEDDQLSGIKLSGIYTVFAVILGFVVFSSWQFYLEATNSVREEAAYAAVVGRNAEALPDGMGQPVLQALESYLALTIEDEWRTQAYGQKSVPTQEALLQLNRTLTALPVNGNSALSNIQSEMVYDVGQMEVSRADRVYFTEDADPQFVWALLLIGGVVVIILSATLHFRSRWMQVMMVSSISGIIAISLFSVYALNRPFSGPFAVSPAPLIHVQQTLTGN